MKSLSRPPATCFQCKRSHVYVDKHRFAWCDDCERLQGRLVSEQLQPSLFEPAWPGDLSSRPAQLQA